MKISKRMPFSLKKISDLVNFEGISKKIHL